MLVALDPKSLGEIARSISKARMSVKSKAFVLIRRQRRFMKKKYILELDADGYDQRKK